MSEFNKLYEAMSRRDFLKPIKKSKKTPEQVEPTQPTEPVTPKTPDKKPKGMTRRGFIKKTGGGSVLGALTPVDKVLQSWPDIMSQVASATNWKAIFNRNFFKYVEFINDGVNNPATTANFLLKSIKNLTSGSLESVPALKSFNAINKMLPFLDKLEMQEDLTPKEKNNFISLAKNIPQLRHSPDKDSNFDEVETIAMQIEGPEVWWEVFNDVIKYSIKHSLIDNKTLLKIDEFYPGEFPAIDELIEQKGLKKETQDSEKENKTEDSEKENKTEDSEKENKGESEGESEGENEINYSRMDKAGGSEDVGYAKYYEHMKYDALVNKILSEVVGPNAPGGDSLPSPQKDYKWPSGELTPDLLIGMDKLGKSPKALKETVTKILLEVNTYFENDTKHWVPLVQRILKENKSNSLNDLLQTVDIPKLKSLANILLLAGKSILIGRKHEKDVKAITQLHNAVMQLFK